MSSWPHIKENMSVTFIYSLIHCQEKALLAVPSRAVISSLVIRSLARSRALCYSSHFIFVTISKSHSIGIVSHSCAVVKVILSKIFQDA